MQRPVIETEETLIIETPERVQLEFALASIGNRFLAVLIDHTVQYCAVIAVIYIVSMMLSGADMFDRLESAPKWVIAIAIFVIFLLFTGYFMVFEWWWNGQTPGKRIMKLRVIREDGRPITLLESATRNLLRLFDGMPLLVVPLYSIGLIAIFMNRRDQRLGDIFAGTVVIRERTDEAPSFAETFASRVNDSAFIRVQKPVAVTCDVGGLNAGEVEVVEIFLRRRWDLSDKQRLWMAWRVALPIMFKLKPKYELKDFSYEGFLEEILHRFNARSRYID